MKLFLSLLLVFLPTLARAAYPTPRDVAYELNESPVGQRVRLGTQLEDKRVHVLRGQWDFNVDGGATGQYSLKDIDGKPAVLPPGAIINNCVILVDVALAGTGASVILQSGDTVADIKGLTAVSAFATNDGLVACSIVPQTIGSWKKLPGNYTAAYTPGYTSAFTPALVISGAALTKGKFRLLLSYILSR